MPATSRPPPDPRAEPEGGAPRRRCAALRCSLPAVGYRVASSPLASYLDSFRKGGLGATCKPYTMRTALAAADLLNDRVVPFFEAEGIDPLRIPTDRGSEYCGNVETILRNDADHHQARYFLVQQSVDMASEIGLEVGGPEGHTARLEGEGSNPGRQGSLPPRGRGRAAPDLEEDPGRSSRWRSRHHADDGSFAVSQSWRRRGDEVLPAIPQRSTVRRAAYAVPERPIPDPRSRTDENQSGS